MELLLKLRLHWVVSSLDLVERQEKEKELRMKSLNLNLDSKVSGFRFSVDDIFIERLLRAFRTEPVI